MRSFALRSTLLAVAVLSAVALAARAAPDKEPNKEPPPKSDAPPKAGDQPPVGGTVIFPVKELTEEKLRKAAADALKASRAAHKDFWKKLEKLVKIDADQIVYVQEAGKPVKLTWEAEPTHALSKEERDQAKKDFKGVYDHLFSGSALGGGVAPPVGGLLDKEDAVILVAVTHLEIGPNPGPEKPPVPPPPPPPPAPPPPPMPPAETVDEVALLRRELDDTRRQLDKLRQDLEDKRHHEEEEKRQKELDETRLHVEKLQLELDDLRKQGDKREKDLDESRAEAEKRLKEVEETRLQLEKLRLELDALRKQGDKDLDDLRKQGDKRDKDFDDLRKQGDKRDKDLDDLRKQGDKRDKDIEDLRRDGEKRERELDAARLEAEKRLKELEETRLQVEKLRLELTDLRREGERRQRESDEMKLQGEQMRRQLEETRRLVERLQRRLNEPQKYTMVVQPSSMVYYDYCNMVWVQGPSSVTYYPVDSTEPAAPREHPTRPPSPPEPRGTSGSQLPPPVMPPSEGGGLRPPAPELLPQPPPANLDDGLQGRKDAKPDEADRLFWVGYRGFWQGDYDKALASFDGAIRIDARDARVWYYKALTERALGDAVGADASVRRGRELHAANRSRAALVSAALERVQGADRRFLNTPEIVVVPDATAAR